MPDATLDADFLVIGAGMAGLSAAASAARRGASVFVIEKGPDIGGSAVLSGGGLWTLAEPDLAEELDPAGDPARARILAQEYLAATQWVETLGADIQQPARTDAIQGFPSVVRVVDVLSYLRLCAAEVRSAGGWIVTQAEPEELVMEGGKVVGAVIRDRDGLTRIDAPSTLLATGGFGGDASLRRSLIGDHAADLPVRANSYSTGAGIRLAMTAGAALRPQTGNFYGHLIATPRKRPLEPRDFIRLAQIASPRTLLLDRAGRRFTDESKSYYGNASAVAQLPGARALLIQDEAVRQYDLTAYAGTESIDRFEDAAREGAHVARAETLDGLEQAVGEWGYHGVAAAVRGFNEAVVSAPERLDPPRRAHRRAFEPPYLAMEVEPAITQTFRGLMTDAEARVLDASGTPIPGLLAAGADACFYEKVYFGGLSPGLVFGLRAARSAWPDRQ